jgi:hypothetical protein
MSSKAIATKKRKGLKLNMNRLGCRFVGSVTHPVKLGLIENIVLGECLVKISFTPRFFGIGSGKGSHPEEPSLNFHSSKS